MVNFSPESVVSHGGSINQHDEIAWLSSEITPLQCLSYMHPPCTIGTDRMNKGLAARAEEGRGKNKSLAGWDFHHSIRDAVNRVLRGLASDRNTVAFVDVGHCS